MIRLALLLRYKSLQCYKILVEHFPLPSLSSLAKLKSSSVDAIKAAQLIRKNGAISDDIILMADKMYLQKKVQYSGGDYVSADNDGNLYKEIFVFMISKLKKSLPIVIKGSPETKLNGMWIAEQFSECIAALAKKGFKVHGIVTDNHSANVAAFNILMKKFSGEGGFHSTSKQLYLNLSVFRQRSFVKKYPK